MLTRCPVCSTVFRVTSEQLRLKAGKVRCGQCQSIFNAHDEVVSTVEEHLVDAQPPVETVLQDDASRSLAEVSCDVAENEPETPEDDRSEYVLREPVEVPVKEPSTSMESELVEPAAERILPDVAEPGEVLTSTDTEDVQAPLVEPTRESPEESTQAARQAGLVAARELNDTPSFNRWSAGTLASDGLGGFDGDSNRRAVWPFVLVAMVLFIGLLGQLLYFFRTDVVLRFPGAVGLYELAAVDIPLPRNSALVSIETSDLQSDNARGLFVLQATLKNRAAYAQGWPALELSLTDSNDAVVSRRVMFAADYLPLGTTSDAFPANGEIAVKLWIEAKESGAAGYRLYIFYP